MRYQYAYDFPVGRICIEATDMAITKIQMGGTEEGVNVCETALIAEAAGQLREYFDGSRQSFALPLQAEGTAFQKKVWQGLRAIPYGETRSYQALAESIGHPKACRAVGGANHCNPIMIVIPCHRVIGKNGSLVGFGGGLDVKAWLLDHEKKHREATA